MERGTPYVHLALIANCIFMCTLCRHGQEVFTSFMPDSLDRPHTKNATGFWKFWTVSQLFVRLLFLFPSESFNVLFFPIPEDAVCHTASLSTCQCWPWHLEVHLPLHKQDSCCLQCGPGSHFLLSDAFARAWWAVDPFYCCRACVALAARSCLLFHSRRAVRRHFDQVFQSTCPCGSAATSWPREPHTAAKECVESHWFDAESGRLEQWMFWWLFRGFADGKKLTSLMTLRDFDRNAFVKKRGILPCALSTFCEPQDWQKWSEVLRSSDSNTCQSIKRATVRSGVLLNAAFWLFKHDDCLNGFGSACRRKGHIRQEQTVLFVGWGHCFLRKSISPMWHKGYEGSNNEAASRSKVQRLCCKIVDSKWVVLIDL